MKELVRIGTSGWTYGHWKGIFYPEDQPKAKWLEYYTRKFDTVELNASFYRLPQETTFKNWFTRTPEGFLWSLKASRYITHIKRLSDVNEALQRFYDRAGLLGSKLGPLLFQLPPSLVYDTRLVQTFLAQLDPCYRHAIEVRNPSWLNSEFLRQIQDNNTAFCISDTAGRYPYGEEITADFVYIRLHGSRKLYASEYTTEELEGWAKKIVAWGRETFVYFDNDFEGYAVRNARQLKRFLGDK
ncbi:MAG: hypothetical protein B1H13_09270 [Desulfobacteraceae bacterium 4484_190.3]|nr:MAG: hypothetical protein B1H13_09270 [Desulfobacteraceae bacterium 4484_190.3]